LSSCDRRRGGSEATGDNVGETFVREERGDIQEERGGARVARPKGLVAKALMVDQLARGRSARASSARCAFESHRVSVPHYLILS